MASSRSSLADLAAAVRAVADVEAFGLVQPGIDADANLYTRHRVGTTAPRLPLRYLPPVLRPQHATAPQAVAVAALDNPEHVFVDRLRQYGAQTLICVPLRAEPGVFWAALARPEPPGSEELAAFAKIAERVAAAH